MPIDKWEEKTQLIFKKDKYGTIDQSFRLEKTFNMTKSNHKANTANFATEPCPRAPQYPQQSLVI